MTEIFVSLIRLPSFTKNPEFQHKVIVYPKLLDLSELFTCCGLLPSAVGITLLICCYLKCHDLCFIEQRALGQSALLLEIYREFLS